MLELIFALLILLVVSLAALAGLTSALRATGINTASTRATQLANETLEELESLPWNALGLYSSDPDFSTSYEGLPTVALPVASPVDPRVPVALRTVSRGGTTFTVRTHIVRLPDPDTTRLREAHRRMTALVDWNAGGVVRRVRVDRTRTPTTGESGGQCFGLRSLEVLLRDGTGQLTPDPFALTGSRTVPLGSQLVVTATTNLPAASIGLVYRTIDPATSTTVTNNVAMSVVSGDNRTWQFLVPVDQQFAAGTRTYTATGTATTTTSACPSATASLDTYPRFTHPAVSAVPTLRAATGKHHSCRIDGNSRAWCWGQNNGGQLGSGTTTSSNVPVAVAAVAEFENLVSISAGDGHTCAVALAGSVWCWGTNSTGQLGNGTTTTQLVPVKVLGLTDAVAVSAGLDYTCAVTRGGLLFCWGSNLSGQLGDGTTTSSTKPGGRVLNLTTAVAVAAGTDHTCAVTSAGQVWCWGSGEAMRLNGAPTTSTPVQIALPGSPAPVVKDVAINNRSSQAHTCVVTTDGGLWCWGDNNNGQVRLPASLPVGVTQVTGLPPVTQVSAGAQYTCASTTNATTGAPEAWCWGQNNVGQLGNGSTSNGATAPGKVLSPSGMTGGIELSASAAHTCARVVDNAIWCWGSTTNGKLGDGVSYSTNAVVTSPVRVSGT